MKHWTPTTLLVRLIKTGAQAAHHAWYVMFQMVGVAVPRKVLAAILTRIRCWAAEARAGLETALT